MRFKNGVVGSLTGSYDIERGHPMERCEVAGVGGRFVLVDMFRELTLYPAGNLETIVYRNPLFDGRRDFTDTFRTRIHRFLEQVNEQPVISLELSKFSAIRLQMGDGATLTIILLEVRDFELRGEYCLWKIAEVPEMVRVEVRALHLVKCFL